MASTQTNIDLTASPSPTAAGTILVSLVPLPQEAFEATIANLALAFPGETVLVATPDAAPHSLPPLTLTRGARHVVFLRGQQALVLLRGDIQHKNLWIVDLNTGAERQLTNFAADFDIRDFDISPDGREVVLERVQERSDVVMLDLQRP